MDYKNKDQEYFMVELACLPGMYEGDRDRGFLYKQGKERKLLENTELSFSLLNYFCRSYYSRGGRKGYRKIIRILYPAVHQSLRKVGEAIKDAFVSHSSLCHPQRQIPFSTAEELKFGANEHLPPDCKYFPFQQLKISQPFPSYFF